MRRPGLTEEEFMSMLHSYGANPARWPRELQTTAMAWLMHPDTQIAVAQTRLLDALLDSYFLPPDDSIIAKLENLRP